jgi:hypothetical protein
MLESLDGKKQSLARLQIKALDHLARGVTGACEFIVAAHQRSFPDGCSEKLSGRVSGPVRRRLA